MYLSGPVLESLWSLSYLSTKYSSIARVSLDYDQLQAWSDDHREHRPNSEVIVLVIDEGGNTTVGVDLQELWSLLFSLVEIEVHRLVR